MAQTSIYKGPLAGLNVIDFGHYYAGPMAGMLLADQGANVIRIVRPGEPELPSQPYRLLNRNKQLLTLDLKSEQGRRRALSLIEQADVIIENFRPGVMARLGLDYASVKHGNPGLVYLSLPGFASTDEARRHIQAWEGVMCAAAGVYTQTSQYRQYLNFPPVYTWVPQCSAYGALNGVIAIAAALVARERHGSGTVIEVPMADGGMFGFFVEFSHKMPSYTLRTVRTGETLVDANDLPAPAKPLVYSRQDSGAVVREKLNAARHLLESSPTWKAYPCADGRQIFIFTFGITRVVDRLLKVLGIDKQVKREGFLNTGPWDMGLANNITDGPSMSPERWQRIEQLIGEALLAKTAEQWDTLLGETGVTASCMRTREEWLAVKPMLEAGVFTHLGTDSAVVVPGRLMDVSGPGNTSMVGFREAETISAARAETLFARPAATRRLPQPLPLKQADLLAGLNVLDMANVAAGPIAGMMLARYGAKVIKADPPYYIHPGLVHGAPGKRSILTDVTAAPGREILQRLIARSDLVLHNILDDTAKRLGVSHEQLKQINPNTIGCQISAFGGSRRGFWELRPGFDNILQSASGLMTQFGSIAQPHWHGGVSCTDVMGAFSLAFAALLGVYQQRVTGYASEVRTALARVVNYAQLPYMIAENGRSNWGEAKGQFSVGECWWQRMYECRDKWIYVGTRENKAALLAATVLGGGALSTDTSSEQSLEKAFAEHDCAYWIRKLNDAGIACHPVMSVDELCDAVEVRDVTNEAVDETARGGYEILRWKDHPCGSAYMALGLNQVRVGENHSYRRLAVVPRLGTHTTEILQELGYTNDEIEKLIRIRVAHEFLPTLGSKEAYFFEPEQLR